jgi:hypothetical protein
MKKCLEQFNFIDIHYHANPDFYERKYSVFEAGREYQKLGGAVVLRSHLGSTAVQATIAQEAGYPVFPSVALNNINGGIHYKSVIRAILEYHPIIPSKIIVDLPTITGRNHSSRLVRQIKHERLKEYGFYPETIFNEEGKIKKELYDLFRLTKDYPIVLSSGHASKEEVWALIEVCEKLKVPALLLNQPANPLTGFSAKELLDLCKYSFVWIEQTALTSLLSYQSEEDLATVLKSVQNVVYSSDFGQTNQPSVPEWHKLTREWFKKFDISKERESQICLKNPAHLLQM